jgi:hypothetical protein
MVVDKNGKQLGDPFPFEPDALVHAEALELELAEGSAS